MKNNIENTPDYIFDWLQQFSFAQLESAMQKEVLLYFELEEYNDLHQGFMAIKTVSKRGTARERGKQELLSRFDNKYSKKQPIFNLLTMRVSLWKAASVLLVITGGLLFLKVNGGQASQGSFTVKTDTVYVTRGVSLNPVEILDTVYIVREESTKPTKAAGAVKKAASETREYIPVPTDVQVLSVDEINGISNQTKGNSIKDDTLVKKFSFVNLL
ncbi:MAG TPA: hypothetical protein VEC12_05690 [Bacteroidia bacterium]|nr:hypothetical protein [Bacteroidia bacterium]